GIVEKTSDTAAVRAYPQTAAPVFSYGVDEGQVKSVAGAVVNEAVAVKPAQPFLRAKPDVAFRILMNAAHAVVRQPVRYAIPANRKLLTFCSAGRGHNHHGSKRHRCELAHAHMCFSEHGEEGRRTNCPSRTAFSSTTDLQSQPVWIVAR